MLRFHFFGSDVRTKTKVSCKPFAYLSNTKLKEIKPFASKALTTKKGSAGLTIFLVRVDPNAHGWIIGHGATAEDFVDVILVYNAGEEERRSRQRA